MGTALDSHSCCCWLVVCWSVVVVVGMHASARGRKGGRASVVNLCLARVVARKTRRVRKLDSTRGRCGKARVDLGIPTLRWGTRALEHALGHTQCILSTR